MRNSIFRISSLSAIAALCLTACGGGGGGGNATAGQTVTSPPVTTPAPPTTSPTPPVTTPPVTTPTNPAPVVQFGTANLSLAGEPGCGFDAVNVSVTKIRFHMSASALPTDAGWTDISVQPVQRINLAKLANGGISNLGTAALLPGHYAQARIVLDANTANDTTNSVVLAGESAETPLLTQIKATAGDGFSVRLPDGFDVVNGQAVNLVADFDACRSVIPNGGGFNLRPVITAIPAVKNGIDGFVEKSLLGKNVRVTAQQNGVVVRATLPDPATGEFLLARLIPGSYDLVITADGYAAGVVAGVKVSDATSVLQLNSAAAPINMPVSQVGSIDSILVLAPFSSVEAAFGSALQNIVNGPVVTISDRVAMLGIGKVRFPNLPLSTPSFAVYQAGQPLTWTLNAPVTQASSVYDIISAAPGYVTGTPTPTMAK